VANSISHFALFTHAVSDALSPAQNRAVVERQAERAKKHKRSAPHLLAKATMESDDEESPQSLLPATEVANAAKSNQL
jgi:hypothetical protein